MVARISKIWLLIEGFPKNPESWKNLEFDKFSQKTWCLRIFEKKNHEFLTIFTCIRMKF